MWEMLLKCAQRALRNRSAVSQPSADFSSKIIYNLTVQMASAAVATLPVPKDVLSSISPGGAKCVTLSGHHVIIYKGADGKSLKACQNKCEHLGGTFAPDVEDASKMKCGLHAWRVSLRRAAVRRALPHGTEAKQSIIGELDWLTDA